MQLLQSAVKRGALWGMILAVVAGFFVPGRAQAAPNPFSSSSAWSVPVRYAATMAAQPNGGVVANTATASGGVPQTGDALVGVAPSGDVKWRRPYEGQYIISPGPITDARGDQYYIVDSSSGAITLVASREGVQRWAKNLDAGPHLLALGANGQLYHLDGNVLHGYDAASGSELFEARTLHDFSNGSYDRLFAYDRGLVAYSGAGSVTYLDYSGIVTAGPFEAPLDAGGKFLRDSAASAAGELYVVWYTEGLTPDACLSESGQAKLSKYTPVGLSWTKELPHVARCNYGGPYVAASPLGGAVVASDASGPDGKFGSVMYINGSGQTVWQQRATAPAQTYERSVEPVHVDENGQAVLVSNFAFDCQLWSDTCMGTQIHRFAADGTPLPPIVLKSDPLVSQQSWLGGSIALTPDRVVMALRHFDKGFTFASQTDYTMDAFDVPGLGAEYPQAAMWGLMSGPQVPPTTENKSYVALGDSYSSGEGSGDYSPDSNSVRGLNTCHRSAHAYGPLLSKSLNLTPMTFAACSGAVTDDFFVGNPVNLNEPAQLSRLNASTQVVTLTIGGNDSGFVHTMTKCADGFYLPNTPPQDKGKFGCSKNKKLQRDIDTRLALLGNLPQNGIAIGRPIHALVDLYRAIHLHAPQARIYVAGYPHLFGSDKKFFQKQKSAPSGSSCYLGTYTFHGVVDHFHVDYSDAVWLNQTADRLNGTIQSAVADSASAGVPISFVSADKFNGHGLCDAKATWFHGLQFVGETTEIKSSTFHPIATGQDQGYKEAFKLAIS